MTLIAIVVIWFMAGSILFTIWPDYSLPIWNTMYYIWDAARDLLLVVALHNLIPKVHKWALKPLIFYTSIRLLWEITQSVTVVPLKVQEIMNIGFLVLSTGAAILLLKDLVLRWKQN